MKSRYLIFLAIVALGLSACAGPKRFDYSQTEGQVQIPRDDETVTNGQFLDIFNANIPIVDGRLDDLEARPEAITARAWDSSKTYSIGDLVTDPTEDPAKIYISKVNGNTNNLVTDTDYWGEPPSSGSESGASTFAELSGDPGDNIALSQVLLAKANVADMGTASARAAADNLSIPDALPDTAAVNAALAALQDEDVDSVAFDPATKTFTVTFKGGTSEQASLATAFAVLTDGSTIAFTGTGSTESPLIPEVVMDGSGNSGNLPTTVDTPQELLEAVDNLTLGSNVLPTVSYSDAACTPGAVYRFTGDNSLKVCVASGNLDNADGTDWSLTSANNLWDDTLASGATGWTYNGDNTWTCDGTSGDVFINDLVAQYSTVTVEYTITNRTAGFLRAKVGGTIDSGQESDANGSYSETITDTSGFARTGVASVNFVGTVEITSVVVQ